MGAFDPYNVYDPMGNAQNALGGGPQTPGPGTTTANDAGTYPYGANSADPNDPGTVMLQFKMPDGSTQTVGVTKDQLSGNASPELQGVLRAGGQPVDPKTGQTLSNYQPNNPDGTPNLTSVNGGTLWQGADGTQRGLLQVAFPGSAQATSQQNAVSAWQQNPRTPLTPDQAALVPGYKPPAPGGPNSGLIGNLDNASLPLIPGINLGAPPQISSTIDPGAYKSVQDVTQQASDAIGGQFTQAQQNMPQAQAAQTNLGQVPQTQMTAMPISDQVNAMLSGNLGYSPQVLAEMKANATDSTAQMGQSEMAQAQRALEQSGMGGGSGMDSAVRQDIARQTGAANTTAQNAIDTQNANVAQQNFQSGVGYQQNALTDNFQMANQMALDNATKLFSAIQQNTSNQQAAGLQNAGAAQSLNAQGAQDKASFDMSQAGNLNSATLQQASNASLGNTQNTINQGLNQAGLDRGQALANLQAGQNQWQIGSTLMAQMANPQTNINPAQTQSVAGPALQNIGASLLNQGTKGILGATQ